MSEGNGPPDIKNNDGNTMDTDEHKDSNVLQSELQDRQHVLSNCQIKSIGGFSFGESSKNLFSFMNTSALNTAALNSLNTKLNPDIMVNDKPIDSDLNQKVTPVISGADIYTTVLSKKRGRSPQTKKSAKVTNKVQKTSKNTLATKNRFSIFDLKNNEKNKQKEEKMVSEKPSPFYVRGEKNTSDIRKWMSELQITDYDIKILFSGHQAKLQVKTVDDYRKIQKFFEVKNIPNYTYQLKSARSVRAVIIGLDPRIDSDEIIQALIDLNFTPRNVYKSKNKKGVASNVVFVELEPCNEKSHPIFELKRLLNMVVSVEEPKKNNQPRQCYNCQEYGHTKNSCFLTPICAICAEKHATNLCDKDKKDTSAKVCNNCGENHTANWKGCQVYQVLYERLNPKQRREQRIANNQQKNHTKNQNTVPKVIKGISYANVVTGNLSNKNDESINSNDLIKLMLMMQSNIQALQSNISDILKKQNALENSIAEINKMMSKICKQK